MAEINEELQDLKNSIQELSMILTNMGSSFNDTRTAMGSFGNVTKQNANFQTEALQKTKATFDFLGRNIATAAGSLSKLSSSALSTANSFEFAGKAVNTVGSAAAATVSQFGTLGKGTGFLIQAFSNIVESVLSFGTSALDAKDVISSMGAAGRITSTEIENMAKGAQMFGVNMVKYAKTIKDVGPDILGLGKTVEEGVLNFGIFTKLTKDQITSYQKLGINQEQLIAGLADYVKLQTQSGVLISREMITSGKLQKAALDYTEKLNELATLTGIDVDTQKKRQFQAAAEYDFQIKRIQVQERLAEAEKTGNQEQISAYKKQLEGLDSLNKSLGLIDDANTRAAVKSYVLTGAYTEQTQGLALLQVNMEKYRQGFIEGKDVGPEMIKDIMFNIRRTASSEIGTAATFGKEVGQRFMLSSENLMQSTRLLNSNLNKGEQAAAAQTEMIKRGLGKPDPLEDMREKFTKVLLTLQEALQNLANVILNKIYPNFLKFGDWLEINIPKITTKIQDLIDGFDSGLKGATAALGVFALFVSSKLIGELSASIATGLNKLGIGPAGAVVAGAAAAGTAGYMAGSYINEKFGISQWIVDWLMEDKDKAAMGPMVMNAPSSSQMGTSTAGAGRGAYGMPLALPSEGVSAIDPLKRLNIKGSESVAGGKVSPSLIQMAHNISSAFPGVTFTALNDMFHKNYPDSKHNQGVALDFVLSNPPKTREEAEAIKAQLYSLGATKVLDEYFSDRTSRTTGGHFHVEVGSSVKSILPIPQNATSNISMPSTPKSSTPTATSLSTSAQTVTDAISSISSTSRPDSIMSSIAIDFSNKMDQVMTKLDRIISVDEDLLKYAKYKS